MIHELDDSLMARLARLPPEEAHALLENDPGLLAVLNSWEGTQRSSQKLPPWDEEWDVWLYLAGRGAGKTLTARNAVQEAVWKHGVKRIAVCALTVDDARRTLIQGPVGFGNIPANEGPPLITRSPFQLHWSNGAHADVLTAAKPEQGRGPGYELVYADELAQWRGVDKTGATLWDNLIGAAREGDSPRAIVSTTPRPTELIRGLVADPGTRLSREPMMANAANLPTAYIRRMLRRYPPGTVMHKQEILGEVVADIEGALWTPLMLDAVRRRPDETVDDLIRQCSRIVIGVDPAKTDAATSDETGIAVAGKLGDRYIVFAIEGMRAAPAVWARRVYHLADTFSAGTIFAENNTGGDMIKTVLRTVGGDSLRIEPFASVISKTNRADPVAALYTRAIDEPGLVTHTEVFSESEEQMIHFPVAHTHDDRVDALVFALRGLMRRRGGVVWGPGR